MLVEELFIILLYISDLYGVRYFNYDLNVFQFEQLLDIFGPLPGPLPQNRTPGQYTPLIPLLIGPGLDRKRKILCMIYNTARNAFQCNHSNRTAVAPYHKILIDGHLK